MTDLERRVLAGLRQGRSAQPLEQLISLFEVDREAFYRLATEDVEHSAKPEIGKLAELAHQVRRAVQESYALQPSGAGATMTTASGASISIPAELVAKARHFFREIDGKKTDTRQGKDYEGTEISEAEARFKLGDPASWAADHKRLTSMRDAKPMVLRVSQEDLDPLATQPAYVTYELLHCARKTILAPRHVFKGLKRGSGAPTALNKGWAFCAKPRQAYHNDGTPAPRRVKWSLSSMPIRTSTYLIGTG